MGLFHKHHGKWTAKDGKYLIMTNLAGEVEGKFEVIQITESNKNALKATKRLWDHAKFD